ncbi:MAG: glycosyltransferase [Candidatus Eremiobacteraeota bacterium]|nr:glycosyltransferase [Candidatus Eremiobacteraeota bacterium]
MGINDPGEEQRDGIGREIKAAEEETARFSPEEIEYLYSKDFSIIITTHNGKENLEKNLPWLFNALNDYSEGKTEVLLLINGSEDDTEEFIKKNYGDINIIKQDKVTGLCTLINEGMKNVKFPVAYIMEDDVQVTTGFMRPLLYALSMEDFFSVVPAVRLRSRQDVITSIHLLHYKNGVVQIEEISDSKFPDPVYIPSVSFTSTMLKVDMFRDVGGFDPLFDPCYFGDLDLGYRAWKRGFRIVYCRDSLVYHDDRDPLRDTNDEEKNAWVRIRNYNLFVGKNITQFGLYLEHRIKLFKQVSGVMLGLNKDKMILKGWRHSLKKIWEMAKKRKMEKKESCLSDSDLFVIFSTHPDNRLKMS